jgi:hypothetical protein
MHFRSKLSPVTSIGTIDFEMQFNVRTIIKFNSGVTDVGHVPHIETVVN